MNKRVPIMPLIYDVDYFCSEGINLKKIVNAVMPLLTNCEEVVLSRH